MISRILLLFGVIFLTTFSYAQIKETFESLDGWQGDLQDFSISAEQNLQLTNSSAGESYLSVPSVLLDDSVSWQFTIKLDFNPSGSNYSRVYLASDNPNLKEDLTGYYVMVGDTEDEISLYYQEESQHKYIINGPDDLIDQSAVEVKIKVIKNRDHEWSLWVDADLTGEFVLIGTASHDPQFMSTYAGWFCDYTVTRSDKFFLDDFSITGSIDIKTVKVLSPDSIMISMNQPVQITESTYFKVLDGEKEHLVHSVELMDDDSKIILTLDSLVSGNYSSMVDSLNDSFGNVQSFKSQQLFYFEPLSLISATTPTRNTVNLNFNQAIYKADRLNFLVDKAVGYPGQVMMKDSVIELVFEEEFLPDLSYKLSIIELENQTQNSTLNTEINFEYVLPFEVDTVYIISDDQLFVGFTKAPKDPVSPGYFRLLNYTSPPNEVIQDNALDFRLIFDESFKEGSYFLIIDSLLSIDGQYLYQENIIFRHFPLLLDSSFAIKDQVHLLFNQSVRVVSDNQFELQNSSSKLEVIHQKDSLVIVKALDVSRSRYSLSIDQINNLLGTSEYSDTINVFLDVPIRSKELIFTELLADPTPVYHLPDAEYIEIFNTTRSTIELSDCRLNNDVLPPFELGVGQHLVITDEDDVALFNTTNILGISSFDALTNSGESLVLTNPSGSIIDSLYYHRDWYDSAAYESGGYSLENIHYELNCHSDFNWTGAKGSPGLFNLTIDSTISQIPPLFEVTTVDSSRLDLTFNRPFLQDSIKVFLNDQLFHSMTFSSSDKLSITLERALTSEVYYEIRVTDFADCGGKKWDVSEVRFYYDRKAPELEKLFAIAPNEIALVYSEPVLKSIAENETNFNVADRSINRAELQDSARNRIHVQFDRDLSSAYIDVLIENIEDTLENHIAPIYDSVKYIPVINEIKVITSNALEVSFTDSISTSAVEEFIVPSVGRPREVLPGYDDYSFRLLFEQEINPNKPYRLYFERDQDMLISDARSFTWDLSAPEAYLQIIDSVTINVIYNESVDLVSAINLNHYEVENNQIIEILLLSDNVSQLKILEPLPQEEKIFIWIDGVKDRYGNEIRNEKLTSVFDTRPPIIQHAIPLSDYSARLTFNEISKFEYASFSSSDLAISSVDYVLPDSLSWILQFKEAIPAQDPVELKITDFMDSFGNRQQDSIVISLSHHETYLTGYEFIKNDQLRLLFSREIDSSSRPLVYYMDSDETIWAEIDSSYLHVNFKNPIDDFDILHIRVDSLLFSNESILNNLKLETQYKGYFENLDIIDSSTLLLTFERPIAFDNKLSFRINDISVFPSSVPGEEKSILLFLSQPIAPNIDYELSWQDLSDLYGRRIPDGEVNVILDTQPPLVETLLSFHHGLLEVHYTEEILLPVGLISITNEGREVETFYKSEPNVLQMIDDQLEIGKSYHLIIKGVSDIKGNMREVDTIQFIYDPPDLPVTGEVILNEFMPNPMEGRPEYIELLNYSDKPIQLNLTQIADGSGKRLVFPDYSIMPGEYLLISESQISEDTSTKTLIIPGLPSLNNSGDEILLTDLLDRPLDYVVYEYSEEGISFERINPENVCDTSRNWTLSASTDGSTPGRVNSVFNSQSDNEAPKLIAFEVISNTEVLLKLDEDIETIVTDSQHISEIRKVADQEILIRLKAGLIPGKNQKMHVSGIYDCSGNQLDTLLEQVYIPRIPDWHELLITEIMFDPEPTKGLSGNEYIEVFNNSPDIIDLSEVYISDLSGRSDYVGGVIFPGQYICLSDKNFEKGVNSVTVPKWRSLANDGERISLWVNNLEIHWVHYEPNFFDEQPEGGISIEMMSLMKPCEGVRNWSYSEDRSGGTPGLKNSKNTAEIDGEPPSVHTASWTENQIQIVFTESLNPNKLPEVSDLSTNRFQTDWDTLAYKTFNIDIEGGPETDSINFFLSDFEDCHQNSVLADTAIVFKPDESYDSLFISEVLFDTDHPDLEFVEIHNYSDKIYELSNLTIEINGDQKPVIDSYQLIFPGQFIAFSNDTALLANTFPGPENTRTILQTNLPNLRNDEGFIKLLDQDGKQIEQMHYNNDLQSPFLKNIKNVSIERISFGPGEASGRNWASSSGLNNYATPGYENSQRAASGIYENQMIIEPQVFVPGGKGGHPAATLINYDFEGHNIQLSALVFDTSGKEVWELADGLSTASNGFIRWDGMTKDGRYAAPGRYIIFMEALDRDGFLIRTRGTVVVGW